MVSDEKLIINLTGYLLHLCCFQDSLFIFVFHYFDYNYFGVDLFKVILLRFFLSFLDVWIHILGKFSVVISLNILSALFSLSSPSGIPIMLVCCVMFYRSLRLYTFFSIIFLFCPIRLNTLNEPIIKFVDSSACSAMLLSPSNVHFILFIILSTSKFI